MAPRMREALRLFGGACLALVVLTPTSLYAQALYVPKAPDQVADWPKEKAALQAFGNRFKSSNDLFAYLRKELKGGTKLNPAKLPDWRGIFNRGVSPYLFDPDQPNQYSMPTAKLTPKYHAIVAERVRKSKEENIEYDPALSGCMPPGFPRWLTEPWAREVIVTPDQTWMINELANEIRRIYTDGRDHLPEDVRYPMFDGDSIGFWAGDMLVIHTISLKPGRYQRLQAEWTDKLEVVETWRTVGDTMVAYAWMYDPEVLAEPWFVRNTYTRVDDPDKLLRVDYYDCVGPANTRVIRTPDGNSTFENLDFNTKP